MILSRTISFISCNLDVATCFCSDVLIIKRWGVISTDTLQFWSRDCYKEVSFIKGSPRVQL